MSNNVKDINIKNHTYYFFDRIISVKDLDSNNIKIYKDKESYKNIPIYYIAYVTNKNSKHVKINSVNPLYLMFSRMNGSLKKLKEINI